MKVSELIEALRQQDPNVTVSGEVDGGVVCAEVVSVIGQDRRGPNPVLLLRAETD